MNLTERLPDITAAAWFTILIAGVVATAILLILEVGISGTVSADSVLRYVVRPLIYAISAVILVMSYVFSIELVGRSETDGAITRIVKVLQDAGAAQELRRQNGGGGDGDGE